MNHSEFAAPNERLTAAQTVNDLGEKYGEPVTKKNSKELSKPSKIAITEGKKSPKS